ncbi:MAG: hypothetical protein J6K64_01505 [Clostridia bacterium]|nr:hypothetical protein [Clostridia bacterium]MBQ6718150.1 hypothetical protein [Clostridia bacterium]
MEYKTEFSFPLSEELLKTLGIDEDTAFETYYEDGRIRVRVLDDEELEDEFDDTEDEAVDEEDDDIDLSLPEKCVLCPNFCWHCKKCTIDI